MEKLDLRKDLKHLYQPSAKAPVLVDVPPLRFVAIDGVGDVGGATFQAAIGALYSLAYPLKFGARKQFEIDYPVMPAEGLYWDAATAGPAELGRPDRLVWKLMIMIPDAISGEFIAVTRAEVAAKKDPPRLADVGVETFAEGRSVQIMHVGPYAEEAPTVARLIAFAAERGYVVGGRHHEIYLSDPNRTAPEKLKTVLRFAVRKAS